MDHQIPHHNSPPQQYSPPQKYSPQQHTSPQQTSPTSNPQFHQNLMLWATLQQHQQLQILQAQNMLARASTCFEPQNAGLLVSTPEKRSRTVFSMTQLEELEKVFRQQQYVVGTERTELAYRLRLTEAQVKVWFQNRRIKHRKQIRGRIASTSSDFKIKQENTSPGGSSMSSGISSSASVSPNSLSPLLLAQLMTTNTGQSVVQKPVLVNVNNNIIGNAVENISQNKLPGTTSTFIVSTGEDQDVDVEF